MPFVDNDTCFDFFLPYTPPRQYCYRSNMTVGRVEEFGAIADKLCRRIAEGRSIAGIFRSQIELITAQQISK